MSLPQECILLHNEPDFSVSEHLSEVVFQNPNQLHIQQVKVDGCVYKEGDGRRCDWLINIAGESLSIFIELKGSDIEGAFDQLAQTQQKLSDVVYKHILWIISYSGSPRFPTGAPDLIDRARREHKARLLLRGSPYSHAL